MLWVKAFHLIFMVTWFSGLFYLPRLFVYHTKTADTLGKQQFKIMEKKLYYFIMTPGAILTIALGIYLLEFNFNAYMQMTWLQIKLALVFLLVIYHIYLGKLVYDFKRDQNKHSELFYRWINEIPTLFLIMIIILAVVKPL